MFRGLIIIFLPTGIFTLAVILFYAVVVDIGDSLFASRSYVFREGEEIAVLGNEPGNLFWFVHISDIHLSKFRSPERTKAFRKFTGDFLQTGIDPQFVIVTGDLTDAKAQNHISSQQYIEEWATYSSILSDNGILQRKNFWFDVRGNHDSFDVPSFKGHQNLFRKYSVSKVAFFEFMYNHTFGEAVNSYQVIGFDACPASGTRRPFNFFGHVGQDTVDQLESALQKSSSNRNIHHRFVIGHYPLSVLTSKRSSGSGRTAQELIDLHATMYFCGHLHTLFGFVPRMHIHHRKGMVEAEIGDWKDHRKFRVVVVDHDVVSFADLTFQSSAETVLPTLNENGIIRESKCSKPNPAVLISNPKNALYQMPGKEPTAEIVAKSTHIRVLLFMYNEQFAEEFVEEENLASVMPCHSVLNMDIFIDGVHVGTATPYQLGREGMVDGSKAGNGSDKFINRLYTLKWNPRWYKEGLHSIKVEMLLMNNESGKKVKWFFSQKFSVDGKSPLSGAFLPRIVLKCDLTVVGQVCFYCLYFTIVGGLLLLPKLIATVKSDAGLYGQWKLELFYRSVGINQAMKTKTSETLSKARTKYSPTFVNIMVKKFGSEYMNRNEWKRSLDRFFLQCVVFSELTELYLPVLLYGLYLSFGPWLIGGLNSNTSSGMLFIFGAVVDGEFLSLSLTYYHGIFYLLLAYFPLILYLLSKCVYIPAGISSSAQMLSSTTSHKRRGSVDTSGSEMSIPARTIQKRALKLSGAELCMTFSLDYQMYTCVELYQTYGLVAVLLSPIKVWFIALSFYLIYRVRCLQMRADFSLDYMRLGKLS